MKYFLATILLVLLIVHSCNEHPAVDKAYELHGIDVSHYQSHINWDTVAAQDIDFTFIKATEGYTISDSLFCRNWEASKRVGIRRGAYHFFRPRISGEEQALHFVDWVDLEYGDLPPVLDVEVLDGVSKVALIGGVRDWLFTVEIKYNIKPIIYTNLRFYNKYLAGHFNDYPVWIARYSVREPILANAQDWHFWQYIDDGQILGIDGKVDFNVFHGDLEDLDQLCYQPLEILSTNDAHTFLK